MLINNLIVAIIHQIKLTMDELEEKEINLENCIEYLDCYKLRKDFENMLNQRIEKEAKEQEKDDKPINEE